MNRTQTRAADTQAGFGMIDWLLSLGMALTWGSSFLLIDIAIRHFHTSIIPFGRTGFGIAALLLLPSARHRVAHEHWPRLIILGFAWMAMPFLLYPLAEHTVSSSITGMMNGALPVFVAVVTAIWIRTMPRGRQMFAVLIGFCGILLIALPTINDGVAADVKGILYLVAALLSYAVAINIARPLQVVYTPATLMLHVEIVAFALSAPYGIWGLNHSTFSLSSLSALAVLGVLGTGFAFVLFATLSKRTGAIRSMIPTYFTPIVATILGTTFNDEPLLILSLIGMFVVIVGAYLMSKSD